MHIWKSEKLRSKYDLLRYMAKNDGLMKFTEDELNGTDLKGKSFQGVKETSVRRLIELAFLLGNLQGLVTADKELDDKEAQNSNAKMNTRKAESTPVKDSAAEKKPALPEEQLYAVVCKVKNRQDKITYVTHCVKARSEEGALSAAATESGMRNQTLLKGKVLKAYSSDSMQFQFGIGQKETEALAVLGKKYL